MKTERLAKKQKNIRSGRKISFAIIFFICVAMMSSACAKDEESGWPFVIATWEPEKGEVGRGAVEDPEAYWDMNGYPDYVSFAGLVGGEMLANGASVSWCVIGVVNASEVDKQAVIDLLSPNLLIQFMDCSYSHKQRMEVYNEILGMDDPHILEVSLLPNSEGIIVRITENQAAHYTEVFRERFGNMIAVNHLQGNATGS